MDNFRVHYYRPVADGSSNDKLRYLGDNKFADIEFRKIKPDKYYNWINLTESDYDSLIPLVKGGGSKLGKSDKANEKSIFTLFSYGVVTNRDSWVYDVSSENVRRKIQHLVQIYESERKRFYGSSFDDKELTQEIKWTQDLKSALRNNVEITFDESNIISALYRPYVKQYLYYDSSMNWSHYRQPSIFPSNASENLVIYFSDRGYRAPYSVLAADSVGDFHLCASADAFQCVPLYQYDNLGNRVDNITDWALAQFRAQYAAPTKQDIFHYVYAVLHHPAYREKYQLNLKREFPRIPFYDDFWQWAAWGEQLMALHLHYETIEPYPLERRDIDPDDTRKAYKARLKADKENGVIYLDTYTTLSGIPPAAWEYKLGNRSAIEWVLDRYKERKPRDPTIREKFNTYQFADYKEDVVDLVGRVTAVSVATMEIVRQMPKD